MNGTFSFIKKGQCSQANNSKIRYKLSSVDSKPSYVRVK